MMLASRGHLHRGVWDLIAGGSEENCLDYLRRLALAEPMSLCHHSSFIIAEDEGRPAAALCGFDPRAGGWEMLSDAMKNVQRQKRWTQADEKASADRTAPVWKCTFDTLDGAWVVESVATLPEYRRRGLTDSLMREILEIGRGRGHRIAQLTITDRQPRGATRIREGRIHSPRPEETSRPRGCARRRWLHANGA
jgi:translation initiation factor 4G